MKISSHFPESNIKIAGTELVVPPNTGLFKNVLEQLVSSEKAVNGSLPKLPEQFRGLVELQRSCSSLQLQIECASRVADSISSSVKKIQQMGGQG